MLSTQIDLGELIRIIQANGNKYAISLFNPKGKDTKIRRLARKFASQKNPDERAWALEIFGDTENSTSYMWHRAQLRRALLDRIFNLEIRTGAERRKAIYRLRKSIFLIKTLLLLGARRTAMSLVPVTMKTAKEFELTSDRVALLEVQCANASLNGWRLKFERYDKEMREAMRLLVAESEITSLIQQIDVESVGRARPSPRALKLCQTAPYDARMIFREFPTFNVGLTYYRVGVSAAQMENDFKRGLALCEQAVAFLGRFPKLYTSGTQGEFELNRLWMALASRSFEEATEYAERCQTLFREGTNNWFIAREFEFLLCMHTEQWPAAVALHKLVVNQSRFPSQPEQVQQKWELFGHYAALTFEAGLKNFAAMKSNAFRKIVHEVPIYHQDKNGYNASLLILQYLILALQRDRRELLDKSEAMAKYVYRNFRGLHDGQLYAFLKTLLVLTTTDFDVEKTKIHARRYIEQFSTYGREKVDETQTLPFDLMWGWIVNSLGSAG
jgi:hypothetical protein